MVRNQRGITLVALVITIIVLLILAGVSISLVVGNNGVLTQASTAVVENKKAAAKEEIAMAWASLETEYWANWAQNSATTRASVFTLENMQKYLDGKGTVGSIDYIEGGTSTVSYTSNTDPNVEQTFNVDENGVVSENLWTIAVDENSNGEADVGDEVTASTGESFYVIPNDSNTSSNKITLLSKYNLATSKNALGRYYQQNGPHETTECTFANGRYWTTTDINSATGYTEGDAQEKAITYGKQNGGTGRLLTASEVDALKNDFGSIIFGNSTGGYFYYWLGSAKDTELGCVYLANGGGGRVDYYGFNQLYFAGVRPVIEVSASNF